MKWIYCIPSSPPGWEAPRGQSSLGAKTHFHICISHKEKFEMNGQMNSYVSTKADYESLPVLGEQRCGWYGHGGNRTQAAATTRPRVTHSLLLSARGWGSRCPPAGSDGASGGWAGSRNALCCRGTSGCLRTQERDKSGQSENRGLGLPWWLRGKESTTCQCRRHGVDPWVGKILHVTQQLNLCTPTTESTLWSPSAATTEARVLRACALQWEAPTMRSPHPAKSRSRSPRLEKSLNSNEDPAKPKTNKQIKLKKENTHLHSTMTIKEKETRLSGTEVEQVVVSGRVCRPQKCSFIKKV